MAEEKPLRFVVMVGSLRRGSFNAAIARALPALAPEGVTIEPLGSVGDFPLYNADVQAEGFPPVVTAMAEAIRGGGRRDHRHARVQSHDPRRASRTRSTGSPACPTSRSPASRSRSRAPRRGFGAASGRSSTCATCSFIWTRARSTSPRSSFPQVQTKVDVETSEITDAATRGFIADQLEGLRRLRARLTG